MLFLFLYGFLFPFRFLFRFRFLFLFLFPFQFPIPHSGFPLFQTPGKICLREIRYGKSENVVLARIRVDTNGHNF